MEITVSLTEDALWSFFCNLGLNNCRVWPRIDPTTLDLSSQSSSYNLLAPTTFQLLYTCGGCQGSSVLLMANCRPLSTKGKTSDARKLNSPKFAIHFAWKWLEYNPIRIVFFFFQWIFKTIYLQRFRICICWSFQFSSCHITSENKSVPSTSWWINLFVKTCLISSDFVCIRSWQNEKKYAELCEIIANILTIIWKNVLTCCLN